MTNIEATAEVFLTAFRALPQKGRAAIIAKLFDDKEFNEDLIDIAILKQREGESSRPIETYLARRKDRTNHVRHPS